jgi:hypothetical protein
VRTVRRKGSLKSTSMAKLDRVKRSARRSYCLSGLRVDESNVLENDGISPEKAS